jgi:hypothetical protein
LADYVANLAGVFEGWLDKHVRIVDERNLTNDTAGRIGFLGCVLVVFAYPGSACDYLACFVWHLVALSQ